MTLIPAIIAYLKAQSAVSDIAGERIHEAPAPASHGPPRVTLQLISGTVERHMTAQSDLANDLVQINCYADTGRVRGLLAKAVYGKLGGYPGGTMGSGDIATHVRSVTRVNRGVIYEGAGDATENHVVAVRHDYAFWHRETVPTFS